MFVVVFFLFFACHLETFHFIVVPFGLGNAPSMYFFCLGLKRADKNLAGIKKISGKNCTCFR